MRIRRFCLGLVTLLVPAVCQAHDHKVDVFGGYSFARASTNPGGTAAVATPFTPVKTKDLSVFFDFSIHDADDTGALEPRGAYLTGFRYAFDWNNDTRTHQRVVPYAHFLIGGLRSVAPGRSKNELVTGAGAGVDVLLKDRPSYAVGFRVQVDYIVRDGSNVSRYSVGGVTYFKNKQ